MADEPYIHVELHPDHLQRGPQKKGSSIFYEWDPQHPEGDALVVAGRVVKVFPTPRVMQAIANKLLVRTNKPPTAKAPDMSDIIVSSRTDVSPDSTNKKRDKANSAASED